MDVRAARYICRRCCSALGAVEVKERRKSLRGRAKGRETKCHRDERLNSQVPDDYPRDTTPALLSGTQPKLSGRWIDGRPVVGLTAEERFIRWDMCEDLAQQFIRKTLEEAAKYPQHSRDVTLNQMRRPVEGKRWTSVVETDWLVARLRILLGW